MRKVLEALRLLFDQDRSQREIATILAQNCPFVSARITRARRASPADTVVAHNVPVDTQRSPARARDPSRWQTCHRRPQVQLLTLFERQYTMGLESLSPVTWLLHLSCRQASRPD